MKVKALIEELSKMDQNLEVKFVYNYGDYWQTKVASSVDTVSTTIVEYSQYHGMDKIVNEDYLDDEDDETSKQYEVVVLE